MINTSGDILIAVNTLNRIKKRLPEMVNLGMRRWGKILEKNMKASAQQSGIKNFTGTTQRTGIRYEQGKRSKTGFLFMRLYLIYLDSMKPHYVSISLRRTRILAWARQAGNRTLRRKARMVEKDSIELKGGSKKVKNKNISSDKE